MKFEIEIKFKAGDKAWTMYNSKPFQDTVDKVTIWQSLFPNSGSLGWHPEIRIEYYLNKCGNKQAYDLFRTKNELLDSFR